MFIAKLIRQILINLRVIKLSEKERWQQSMEYVDRKARRQ